MLSLIEEIESCVLHNNLRCALGMALTLPDICARVEFPDERDTSKRYEKWCDRHLFKQGYLPSHETNDSVDLKQRKRIRVIEPKMCYKLRCAFLHSGNLELNQRDDDNYPVFCLQITSTKDNNIYVGSKMENCEGITKEIKIDVRLLTKVLCNAAREFYENCKTKERFENHHINIIDVEQAWCSCC